MTCFLFGHRPTRIPGLFFLVCRRCPHVINLWSGR